MQQYVHMGNVTVSEGEVLLYDRDERRKVVYKLGKRVRGVSQVLKRGERTRSGGNRWGARFAVVYYTNLLLVNGNTLDDISILSQRTWMSLSLSMIVSFSYCFVQKMAVTFNVHFHCDTERARRWKTGRKECILESIAMCMMLKGQLEGSNLKLPKNERV